MEQVLDIYRRPYDPAFPVVCMDECPRQLIEEARTPLPGAPGQPSRYDYEYVRKGTYNVFLGCEPLRGMRWLRITERKTKQEWAQFVGDLEARYPEATRITLVMDNLGTHTPAALYEVYRPEEAKRLWDRFEFVYTPKHGSWLNMAEIELSVLSRQCLSQRIADIQTAIRQVAAWEADRNDKDTKVDWQFTTDDARIKLKRLYPKLLV